MAGMKDHVREAIASQRDSLLGLSHRIHTHPETAFQEHRAASWCAEYLSERGFTVTAGAYGLPTAFEATYGSGSLNVTLCAEYDALPDIGHACGHNIIAAASLGAACGLMPFADDLDMTVRVLGTPGEEGAGGKITLLDRGAFEASHVAMMIHPASVEQVEMPCLARDKITVTYTGREAHASAFPYKGVNAADALSVAQYAIALLRQHIRPSERIHGITTHAGAAPNVIPAHAAATYYVRSESLDQLDSLRARVMACFEAGAKATGATLASERPSPAYSEFVVDQELASFYRANAIALGRDFQCLVPEELAAAGSTDMANVSLAVPAIHPLMSIGSGDASNHQPGFAKLCVSEAADAAVIEGATLLAWTAIDAATDERVRARLVSGRR